MVNLAARSSLPAGAAGKDRAGPQAAAVGLVGGHAGGGTNTVGPACDFGRGPRQSLATGAAASSASRARRQTVPAAAAAAARSARHPRAFCSSSLLLSKRPNASPPTPPHPTPPLPGTCWPSPAGLRAMPTATPAITPASVKSSRGSCARQARQEAQPGAGDSTRSSCGLPGLSGGAPACRAPPSWGLPSSRAAWGSSWAPGRLQHGWRGMGGHAAEGVCNGVAGCAEGAQAGERALGGIQASRQAQTRGDLPACREKDCA